MNEEYFVDSEEEIREREQAEQVRRIVRSEMRRVNSGEADNDIVEDIRRDAEEVRKKNPNWLRWLGHAITGEILVTNEVQRFYNALTLLGVIFFFAVFAMFASFHREMQYAELKKEAALLREKAIRSTERRHQESSHSAIVRRLKQQGLDLEDPYTQPMVLK